MKTSLICGAALAILGVAAAPLISQAQTSSTSSSSTYVETSKIVGTKVKSGKGEDVGVVKDVVLDRNNGCMAYTVLSTGGSGSRITGQSKLVAVPWSVYTVSPDAGYLTVNVERDRIYNAPVFEYLADQRHRLYLKHLFALWCGSGRRRVQRDNNHNGDNDEHRDNNERRRNYTGSRRCLRFAVGVTGNNRVSRANCFGFSKRIRLTEPQSHSACEFAVFSAQLVRRKSNRIAEIIGTFEIGRISHFIASQRPRSEWGRK